MGMQDILYDVSGYDCDDKQSCLCSTYSTAYKILLPCTMDTVKTLFSS